MHVCYLNMPIEYYSPQWSGAISTVTAQQARHLQARGHQVTILTMTDAKMPPYPFGDIVPIEVGKKENLSFPRRSVSRLLQNKNQWDYPYYEIYLRSFQNALRQLKPTPDVIIVNNDLVSPRYIRPLAPQAKIVVWLQNEQRTRQKDMRATIAATDKFVAVSHYIKDWTMRQHGIADSQIDVVLNGVDLESFYPRPNFDKNVPEAQVLFLGRLVKDKSPDVVADAVAALRAEGLPLRLRVAGAAWWSDSEPESAAPFQQSLREKMRAAGAEALGLVPRANVPELVRNHDIVCVLSRWNDPCPLVTFEAMASGCAALASDRGGIPEQVGTAGLIVNPDDTAQVQKALRSLICQPALLADIKRRGVAHAARHSWEVGVDWMQHNYGNNL